MMLKPWHLSQLFATHSPATCRLDSNVSGAGMDSRHGEVKAKDTSKSTGRCDGIFAPEGHGPSANNNRRYR